MKRWLASMLLPVVIVGAGCSGGDAGPVFTADEVPSPTPPPTTQLVVPFTTLPLDPTTLEANSIVLEQLSNPQDGVAEVVGTGAAVTDTVTIDGAETTYLSFDPGAEGRFVARVSVPGAGSYAICIRDTCGAVDVAG